MTQLWVDDDRGVTTVADFDLEVHAGEVFGIAGVEGNGQRELVEALMGMRPKRSGRRGDRRPQRHPRQPRERSSELGVGHVPEDRGKHGVVGPVQRSPTTSCSTATAAARSRAGACATTTPSAATRRELVARVRRPHARARTCPVATSRAATSRR